MTHPARRTETWHLESGAAAAPPVAVQVVINTLSPGARARRAGLALLGGVVVAALVIPIPLIHLVGIPLALLGGIGLAIRLGTTRETLRSVTGPCPRCAHTQDFFVGIGVFPFQLPKDLSCEKCGRAAHLVR